MPTTNDSDFAVFAHNAAGGYATDVRARGHLIRADEPVGSGGGDTGPEPYELLLAALGSCTAITLRMYAARKGWPLADVDIKLRHRRIWAEECSDCQRKTGRVDIIECAITLHGPLDETQRQRLLEVAGHCPVHRTLTNEIKIRTQLAPIGTESSPGTGSP
jgi:putative redox protein